MYLITKYFIPPAVTMSCQIEVATSNSMYGRRKGLSPKDERAYNFCMNNAMRIISEI
jgi:hypothetical protein